jgi:hypothetical protein
LTSAPHIQDLIFLPELKFEVSKLKNPYHINHTAVQEIPPHFTKLKGSLPHSQQTAIGAYLEPTESCPHPHILYFFE